MPQKETTNKQRLSKKKSTKEQKVRQPKARTRSAITVPKESTFTYIEKWDTVSAIITFALPFVVVLSTNLNDSLAMIAILLFTLPLQTALNFCLVQKIGVDKWIAASATLIVGTLLASAAQQILQTYSSISTTSFGLYVHLFCAYPVLYAVFYGRVVEKLSTVVVLSLKNIMYFAFITFFVGGVREILATNTFWDVSLSFDMPISAANLPFFGFIVVGFGLAIFAKLTSFIQRKQAEESQEDTSTEEQEG